ncbi:MAG TPA: hypothetical protein VFP33_09595 [Gallionella sp.]|nr:hypothetical protein [Gallionella sp.]
MRHKRYLLWLLFFCCLTLLPAVVLNWLLIRNEGNIPAISFAASDWQHQTHGITYTPTMGANGLFKTLRLNDRLAETDTMIFGSSTGMPIDSTMMPPGWHLYNFTQSGSPLTASIAQAEYLVNHVPQIKHYIIALDWSLGFVYEPANIPAADLSLPKRDSVAAKGDAPGFWATLQEAVSYPRMAKLGWVLRNMAKSPHPFQTFREYFLQLGSDEYLCPDGKSKGKDFGIHNRGSCNGFRDDGSATYADYNHIDNANRLIIGALASSSKYARALQHTQGAIDRGLFDRLATLNRDIKAKGGTLILYMPPLMPGLEAALMKHPEYSTYLRRTKQDLDSWAAENDGIVVDLGKSEKFGCTSVEFLDEHHADPACYRKVFRDFWQNGGIPVATRPDSVSRTRN